MLLSILIATIPSRKRMFDTLVRSLQEQYNGDDVEILFDDTVPMPVGTKRNILLQNSKGQFVVFIDDDDEVCGNYVEWILTAIKQNPDADCIGIEGTMTTNGKNIERWIISRDIKTWHKKDGIYYRSTNHISPVKREHAIKAGFPDKTWSEDHDYSKRLRPLLKTEVKIEQPIYHYKYVTK